MTVASHSYQRAVALGEHKIFIFIFISEQTADMLHFRTSFTLCRGKGGKRRGMRRNDKGTFVKAATISHLYKLWEKPNKNPNSICIDIELGDDCWSLQRHGWEMLYWELCICAVWIVTNGLIFLHCPTAVTDTVNYWWEFQLFVCPQ